MINWSIIDLSNEGIRSDANNLPVSRRGGGREVRNGWELGWYRLLCSQSNMQMCTHTRCDPVETIYGRIIILSFSPFFRDLLGSFGIVLGFPRIGFFFVIVGFFLTYGNEGVGYRPFYFNPLTFLFAFLSANSSNADLHSPICKWATFFLHATTGSK